MNTRSRTGYGGPIGLLLCVGACGGKADLANESQFDASVADRPNEAIADDPNDGNADGPNEAIADHANDHPGPPICAVDFPCPTGLTMWCVDDTHYQPVATHDCHYICGPGPCTGGTCDPEGPMQSCPFMQTCVQSPGHDHCLGPDAATEDCGIGFCNPAVMSSCGDTSYVPIPGWLCSADGGQGYCCMPHGSCPPDGYCAQGTNCAPGFLPTQLACQANGMLGSCCLIGE